MKNSQVAALVHTPSPSGRHTAALLEITRPHPVYDCDQLSVWLDAELEALEQRFSSFSTPEANWVSLGR